MARLAKENLFLLLLMLAALLVAYGSVAVTLVTAKQEKKDVWDPPLPGWGCNW